MVTTSGAADDDAPPPLLSGVVGWDKSAEQQKKEEEPTTIFADVKWNPSMRLEDLQALGYQMPQLAEEAAHYEPFSLERSSKEARMQELARAPRPQQAAPDVAALLPRDARGALALSATNASAAAPHVLCGRARCAIAAE